MVHDSKEDGHQWIVVQQLYEEEQIGFVDLWDGLILKLKSHGMGKSEIN